MTKPKKKKRNKDYPYRKRRKYKSDSKWGGPEEDEEPFKYYGHRKLKGGRK